MLLAIADQLAVAVVPGLLVPTDCFVAVLVVVGRKEMGQQAVLSLHYFASDRLQNWRRGKAAFEAVKHRSCQRDWLSVPKTAEVVKSYQIGYWSVQLRIGQMWLG